MDTAICAWFLIGLGVVVLWIAGDLHNSISRQKASVLDAAGHCLARLPVVIVVFGLVWPLYFVLFIQGYRAEVRHKPQPAGYKDIGGQR